MPYSQINRWISSRVPITRLYPYDTFLRRCFQKFLILYGEKIHLVGAKPIGYALSGNRILRLNFNSAVGFKGFQFEIPEDSAMYSHVRKCGSWDTLSSHFLAKGLQILESKGDHKVAFVDLGANVGLVTLQTQSYARTSNAIILVEPIPVHIKAIEANTLHLRARNKITIFDFALAKKDGRANIFTESDNRGNTSLLNGAFADTKRFKTNVRLRNSKAFFVETLSSFDGLVLKSDLQGMDASVLVEMPTDIWQRVDRAVVEVWALPEVDRNAVETLVLESLSFHNFGWSPKSIGKVSTSELIEFWLSRSKTTRDLYIKKI